MKIKLISETDLKRKPDGILKAGARLDQLIDTLTTAQASGAPDGACVRLYEQHVMIEWEEER